MEVADSHMLEHPSTFTPSSHADIDMSGDYYDEEYMMHDAHSTAEVVADDGMYDAELEEQTGQTEVEMDEYTDELVDNIETNMGTYIDDAVVTDMTVEDVHLPSSPVVSAAPRGLSPQPAAAQSISPHVTGSDDLIINEVAPANPLPNHSPQSATTLTGDPENTSPENENGKLDHGPHEVIDLTSGGAENPPLTDDSTVTHEGAQTELARGELYEEQDPLTATTSPIIQPSAADQPHQEREEEDYVDSLALNGASGSLATTLRDSEAAEPYDDRAGDGAHSPIEEALVLNQQARDDAADTMEPSPPVRLSYDNESSGTVQVFDLFAPIDTSPKSLGVLFGDNRTLFYDPLSVFFSKLRETEYFSGVAWQDAEMGLTVDLGSHKLSITEDHKQTDEVSIFKLYFIWSGLGLEGSLHMTLHRHPGRFSVQYAQLLDHLEQRDIRGDGVEDLHEIVRREDRVGVVDHTPNHDKEGSAHTVELGDVQRAPAEVHDANAPDLEQDLEPHDERAAGEDARPAVDIAVHAGEGHAQQNEGEDELGDEFPHNAVLDDDQRVDQAVIDALTQVDEIRAPSSPVNETGQADPIAESTLDGDLYDDDEYADEYTELDNTSGDTSEQRRELASLPDKDYDEYEEVEEVNDLAPEGTANGELMQDGDPENYYDEYDDATKEDGNEALPSESPYLAPNSPQVVDSSLETTLPQSPPKQPLKRNIADLENDDQETVDYPSTTVVSLVDTKRAKHT